MSTNDAAMEAEQSRGFDAPAAPPAESLPRFETPIVPQATIAGRALVAVVAIMTFLASLTTGAVMLVRAAASEWQADVGREVTIQIRPNPGGDIELDVAKAAAIARRSAGVVEVRPYSKEETSRLLEPWLGTGLQLDDLPVPRLIVAGSRPARAGSGATAPDTDRVDPGCQPDQCARSAHARQAGAVLAGGSLLLLVFVATSLGRAATRAGMATIVQ
jgi:cell division transport system permease protein